ncbi:response regulator [Nocardioides sp. MAHUQ-72]|uniref:response regulator n=1 Tax=unclassified Nocardioides TaxID=2615069 RepID=UPI003618C3F5
MPQVRVLVVDDQEPFRRAMATVVDATDGFVVVGSVASGEESLVAADELEPDLVLMDVHLPGLDGIEASRRLTAAGGPVVVLLSTYDEDQFDLTGSGAATYLAKATFGPDRLSEAWLAARDQVRPTGAGGDA